MGELFFAAVLGCIFTVVGVMLGKELSERD